MEGAAYPTDLDPGAVVVPEVSRFFGYHHHHELQRSRTATFSRALCRMEGTGCCRVVGPAAGKSSSRVFGMVMEWAVLHQAELRGDWHLARRQRPVNSIAPLEQFDAKRCGKRQVPMVIGCGCALRMG